MWWRPFLRWATLGLLATTLSPPTTAAFIAIDDSDPDTVTITAGDFEGGFYVDGTLLTTGIGASASVILLDGGYTIDGVWVDLGAAAGMRVDILFALPIDTTFATSGIEFDATSDGSFATLMGSLGAFVDPSLYYSTTLPTFAQDGQTALGSTANLSVSFVSEGGEIPEPSSAALLGLALFSLAVFRRAHRQGAHGVS